jgi:hypothetical protein
VLNIRHPSGPVCNPGCPRRTRIKIQLPRMPGIVSTRQAYINRLRPINRAARVGPIVQPNSLSTLDVSSPKGVKEPSRGKGINRRIWKARKHRLEL